LITAAAAAELSSVSDIHFGVDRNRHFQTHFHHRGIFTDRHARQREILAAAKYLRRRRRGCIVFMPPSQRTFQRRNVLAHQEIGGRAKAQRGEGGLCVATADIQRRQ